MNKLFLGLLVIVAIEIILELKAIILGTYLDKLFFWGIVLITYESTL